MTDNRRSLLGSRLKKRDLERDISPALLSLEDSVGLRSDAPSGAVITRPSRPNFTGLASISGGVIFIEDLKAQFVFDPTSVATPDGITVSVGSKPGRWLRNNTPHPSWQSQTTWHINESIGNDHSNGLASNTALASYAELYRRVGCRWRINSVVNVYLDSNITDINLSISCGPNAQVFFHGTRTTVGTGTVTAFSADPHTGEATLLTDTGRTTWPESSSVRMTTGTNIDARMWIAKDKTGGVARMSPPITMDPAVDPFNTNEVALTIGDHYEIVNQTVITTITFDVDGQAGLSQNKSLIIFTDCDFPKLLVQGALPVVFVHCKFHFFESFGAQTTNCCFTGLFISLVNGASNAGLFYNMFFLNIYGVWFFNQHPVFQNTSPFMKSGAVLYFEDYAGFFDTTNPLVVYYGAKIYARHGLYGTGISGAAITVQPGGQFRYTSTVFSFTGQTNDVVLSGRTSTPRIDPIANTVGAAVTTSFTNLALSFGSGGFGGSAHDLYSNASFLSVPDTTF